MAFDINTAQPITKKFDISTAKPVKQDIGKLIEGTGRAVGQGTTFGQGSHLAGIGEGVGSMLYDIVQPVRKGIDNLSKFKNPLKSLKEIKKAFENDYTEEYKKGREDFKKEQKEFEVLNPKLNAVSEMVGAVGSLPVGRVVAKVPKVAKFLKSAGTLKKGATAGATWGGAYGLGHGASNTEGVGFDPLGASLGLGVGTLTGGAIGTAVPLSIMGIKGGINQILKGGKVIANKIAPKIKGNVEQYVVPNGVQTKTFRKLATSPEVQKEALRGDIGMRAEELQNKATEKTLGFVPELFEKVSKDYEKIPKDTFISFDKANTISKMFQAVKDFQFATKFMPKENIEKEVNNLIQKVAKSGKTVNNEYGISFENLKSAMKTTWENSQKAFKDGDNAVGKLYSDIYNVLREARATNSEIEKASQRYADISKAKEMLEGALGVKFEKGANHRQVATKLIQNARNRAGTQLDDTITKVNDILKKYPDLEGAKELQNAIDLAQVAYDFRPPSESKMLSPMSSKKSIIGKTFSAIFENSPQEKAKLLSKNLKEGIISPKDVVGQFGLVNAGKFTTPLNRFLQSQKLYGSKYNPIAMIMRNKQKKDISKYVENSLKNIETDKLFDLGIIANRRLIDDINGQAYSNILDNNYKHYLFGNGIRHGKDHIQKGDITKTDYQNIPEIITDYDKVKFELKKNKDGNRIKYNKKMDNHNYEYVESIHPNKRELRTKSFYDKNNKKTK